MLTLTIGGREYWDDDKEEFVSHKPKTIQLEHSLISLSKWESKWKVPYLSDKPHTEEESIDYIRCMTLTQSVDPDIYYSITKEQIAEVQAYIDDKMTATWFSEKEEEKRKKNPYGGRETVTSELIYYWMIANNIPAEFQKWHLNRLLTLIKVCSIKNTPPEKKNPRQLAAERSALNAARRAKHHSKG